MTEAAHRILLTGFEPFDKDSVNPSWEVARALNGELIADGVVHSVQLPCVFGAAMAALDEALARLQPTLIISLGLAGGRSEITPERVAINIDDARMLFAHALKFKPLDQDTLLNYWEACCASGKKAEALDVLRRALTLDPALDAIAAIVRGGGLS